MRKYQGWTVENGMVKYFGIPYPIYGREFLLEEEKEKEAAFERYEAASLEMEAAKAALELLNA